METNYFFMKRNLALIYFLLAIFLVSCQSHDTGNNNNANPEAVYFDYKIMGNEGSDSLSVKLQFRWGGENGAPIHLEKPARVELDGELIPEDSSKLTGYYYEILKAVEEFTGEHTITFTNYKEKIYREKFSFEPLQLRTELPDEIKRGKIRLYVDGLGEKGSVRLILTDTSFLSEGINRLDNIKNRSIIISEKDLENLTNGPIQLELIKEEERPVKNGTAKGGSLSISYGLKREFMLVDRTSL
jgi:hypothetical protein